MIRLQSCTIWIDTQAVANFLPWVVILFTI